MCYPFFQLSAILDSFYARVHHATEELHREREAQNQALASIRPLKEQVKNLKKDLKTERLLKERVSKSADEEIGKIREEAEKLEENLACKEVELLTLKEEMEAVKEEAAEDKRLLKAIAASLKAEVERQREEVDSLKNQLASTISGAADSVEATASTYISIARRHCLLLGVSPDVVRRLHEFVDPERLPSNLGENDLDPHNPGESDDEPELQTGPSDVSPPLFDPSDAEVLPARADLGGAP